VTYLENIVYSHFGKGPHGHRFVSFHQYLDNYSYFGYDFAMGTTSRKTASRRRPKQLRARQTVEAVLDAVLRVLKREGPQAATTNHIAEVAGVSIGSLYQYFPDKQAIFVALHQRHVEQIDRIIATTLLEHAKSPIDTLIAALVEAMVDAHTDDPELWDLLHAQVPPRAEGTVDFSIRLYGAFHLAISSRARELKAGRDVERVVFTVTSMVESLSHAAVISRPEGLSLAAAKEEAVKAVLAYLHA